MMRTPLFLLLAVQALAASAAFKCVDEKGKAHYEDVPPAMCANVVIYEVNPSGLVVRKIEPVAARPPAVEVKKAEPPDRAAIDRERRDRTLLDTFANEREIDTARDRSLDLIRSRRETAQARLTQVTKHRQQLESGPAAGRADLQSVVAEQQSLEHSIAGYDTETRRITEQFETDKKRWRELKEQQAARR
ncbi:MAG TPA: DUF4124 domain-containing protein [Usitatibacter sp.]|nr:DUF4124 domain-containing protein [Usitatibacter sp.]